ncbi:MAG: response regulator transcription factor [Lachnospiraceae bacterium]|nr:response regulator transcription factor [Lachnospiraceae bacterium]
MKILIIEDGFLLADMMKDWFKKKNNKVKICMDGLEGYEEALKNPYDIIILDIMLPSKDGFSILSDLRSNNIITPVLILSARSELEDKLRGFKSGAEDYLTKPFHIEELEARVNVMVEKMYYINSPQNNSGNKNGNNFINASGNNSGNISNNTGNPNNNSNGNGKSNTNSNSSSDNNPNAQSGNKDNNTFKYNDPSKLCAGSLSLDKNSHILEDTSSGLNILLPSKEYILMEYFLSNPNQLLSKEQITVHIWGYDTDVNYNNEEVYISFLRKKLRYLNSNVSIETLRGSGYRLKV